MKEKEEDRLKRILDKGPNGQGDVDFVEEVFSNIRKARDEHKQTNKKRNEK